MKRNVGLWYYKDGKGIWHELFEQPRGAFVVCWEAKQVKVKGKRRKVLRLKQVKHQICAVVSADDVMTIVAKKFKPLGDIKRVR
jgi:hypothetical protein